METVMLKLTV